MQGARGDSGAVAVDVHSTSGGDNQDSSDNDDDGAGNNVGTTKGTSEGSGGGSDNDSDGGSKRTSWGQLPVLWMYTLTLKLMVVMVGKTLMACNSSCGRCADRRWCSRPR